MSEATSATATTNKTKKVGKKKTPVQKSVRAGIIFPVGRIHRMLRDKVPTKRVSVISAVYLAAILEYLASEVLELTVSTLVKEHVKRISPRHIFLAIKTDEELDDLIKLSTTIAGGGVIPYIHDVLKKKEEQNKPTSQAQKIQQIKQI